MYLTSYPSGKASRAPLNREEEERKHQIAAQLGADLVYFSDGQLDILTRKGYLNNSYRPNLNLSYDDVISNDNIDMMSCFKTLGRKLEHVLEQKNSFKFTLVLAIAFAIGSALCAVLYKRFLAVLCALLMLLFLVITSWAYIFKTKRQQMDYILGNTQDQTFSRNFQRF